MPLLRGVARTAVIAGTATHVSNNVSRRQGDRWTRKEEGQYAQQEQQQPQQAAAAPAAAPEVDPIERLRQLGELRDQGILTEAEFAAQKAKLLA